MSSFSLFDVVAAAESNMLDEMLQNNNGHVAAFNVTDFSTNWKSVYDFLLMNTTGLYPILQHIWVVTQYWANYWLPVFNTLEPLNSDYKIWHQ